MIIEEALPTFMSLINQSLFTGSMDGVKFSVIDPLLKKCGLDSDEKKNYRTVLRDHMMVTSQFVFLHHTGPRQGKHPFEGPLY